MELVLRTTLNSRRPDAGTQGLNLLLLYQQRGFVTTATELVRATARHIEKETCVYCAFWNLELIANSQLMTLATWEVSAADVILFALSACSQSPRSMAEWIHLWLGTHAPAETSLQSDVGSLGEIPSDGVFQLESLGQFGNLNLSAIGGGREGSSVAFKRELRRAMQRSWPGQSPGVEAGSRSAWPLNRQGGNDMPGEPRIMARKLGLSESIQSGAPLVLYVEDEESDAYFMRRAFQRAGLEHCLRIVTDGQAAIDYLSGLGPFANRAQYPIPVVVLLDLNLPKVGGFEVLEWIRTRPQLCDLPVIIFSSSSLIADKLQARQLGATDYMEKPNSGLEFGRVLESLVGKWLAPPDANNGLQMFSLRAGSTL